MKLLILLFFTSFTFTFSAQMEDHLVLKTNQGVIIIELNTEEAPNHFAQITKLVELGIYNGLSFNYATKDYYVQLGSESERKHLFYPSQKKAITPMANEFSQFKHLRRAVTMPSDPEAEKKGGSFVFTILLDQIEDLDSKQTIIGFVTHGMDILDQLSAQEVQDDILKTPLIIESSALRTKDHALNEYFSHEDSFFYKDISIFNASLFIFILLIQLVLYNIKDKLDMAYMSAINLIIFLCCVFSLLVYLYPMARENSMVALGIVLLLLQSFKMMSSLEYSRG